MIRKGAIAFVAAGAVMAGAAHLAEKNPPIHPISPELSKELGEDFAEHNAYWEKEKHKKKVGKKAARLVLVSKPSQGKKYPLEYTCPSPDGQKNEKPTVYTPESRYAGFCEKTGAIIVTAASVKPLFKKERMGDWRDYVVGRQVAHYWNQEEYKDMDRTDVRVEGAIKRSITCYVGEAILKGGNSKESERDRYNSLVAVGEDLLNRHVPEGQIQHDVYQGRVDGECPTAREYLNAS